MSKARILIVHPEHSALALLSSMLKSLGHEIDEAANDRVAVRLMERGGVDLMLAGVDPADADALELLSYMRRKHRQVPVLLLFSSPQPERAKEALRAGAMAVLRYPLPATELRAVVMQALAPRGAGAPPAARVCRAFVSVGQRLQLGLGQFVGPRPCAARTRRGATSPPVAPAPAAAAPIQAERLARELGIVGYDPSLRQAIELAGTIAPTRTPVLIVGEPGTGKALLARMIHALGSRRDQPLVVFDNSALAEVLAEQERQGDSTNGRADAEADWSSKLHQAHGGTLFINEVSGLPENLQAQLLQSLQDREFESNGNGHTGHGPSPDVRFLMSSSDNLPALVEQGKFRQDLYYRISVICLKLSPLRHRPADIEALAEYFRTRFANEFGKNIVGFTHDALESLTKYDWPGNVRELEGRDPPRGDPLPGDADHLRPPLVEPRLPPLDPERDDRLPAPPATEHPPPQGGARGAREADHHPGPPGPELEPPGDRAGARHQPHDALQEDEEVRPAGRWADLGQLSGLTIIAST